METDMDMNEAVDAAVDGATTMGTGDSVPEAATAPEKTPPETETESPAETSVEEAPATDPDEASADDGELAAKLAGLTHDDLVQTPAGKGLTAEMKRVRDRNRELEAENTALKDAKPAETGEDDAEPGELDDDADIFTAGDVKKIVDGAVSKAVKPLQERLNQSTQADRRQVMATGLAALKADKSVPPGVDTSKIVQDSIEALRTSDPAQLALLLSRPNPVEAVWKYAAAFMPETQQAVAKAAKAKADAGAERLAKGQDPDTGDEAQDISSLVADLNG